MKYPKSIENLISLLSTLPSVGPKTAERYVFFLLNKSAEELQRMAQAIAELKEKTVVCKSCGAVSEQSPCSICSDNKRDTTKLCIVANTRDMLSIESTEAFYGYYHILGGVIDTITNIKPENLNIQSLLKKINNKVEEIILGLNPNMEGETTAIHLTKLLKPYNIVISRLAKGLPMGANLEYADEITLGNALKYRNKF